MKITEWIASLLFPPKCVLCGKLLTGKETDLCHGCRTGAPEYLKPSFSVSFVAHWRALWYYEGDVRHSLLRFKFSGRSSYATVYGRLLAMKLLTEIAGYDCVTWVPVSSRRRRERGYDQVALIAQAVGKELGLTPVATLRKIRDNPPQSGIVGQARRKANVLGAYEPVRGAELAGKRILLLDDILTTGATVRECARVLLTAGAKEVDCAFVAAAKEQPKQQ